MTDVTDPRWTVVVPVKGSVDAKTRLGGELSDGDRARIAVAFARDTIAAASAALRVVHVIVVTEPGTLADLDDPDILVIDDPGTGLNGAVRFGIRAAQMGWRHDGVAVLLGDLPALRSDDLDEALAQALAHPLSFVPDAEGTGTSMITAAPGSDLEPLFGPGSAEAHRAAGHRPLGIDPASGLRRDVDTLDALAEAEALGVGAFTQAALAAIRSTERIA